jgi:hypothetical protein
MKNSGVLYYLDILRIDTGSYRLHYRFDQSGSGQIIPNETFYPQHSGRLSTVGQFYNISGSGFLTGQNITIGNPTGLPVDFFSHIFVYEKTVTGGGIIFDSILKQPISSGYAIGVNDANRLYFQYFNGNGPVFRTSDLILGDKNLVAVSKTNNLITFYNYDFSLENSESDEFPIEGDFIFASPQARIGASVGSGAGFVSPKAYSGYLSEYIILSEAVTPSTFRYLCSGLASTYSVAPQLIQTGVLNQITGYLTGLTGITGVVSYVNVITGSGLNPFGTGDYQFFYQTSGVTGFLATGLNLTPLTGNVPFYMTGDIVENVTPNNGFIQSFGFEELSFIRRIDQTDIYVSRIPSGSFFRLNLDGEFNDVEGKFQLDNIYTPEQVVLFANGQAQFFSGFSVTGNVYGSGVVISGDYILEDFLVNTTGFYSGDDRFFYDAVSGRRAATFVTGIQANLPAAVPINSHTYYLNGQLLISGINYHISGGAFRWFDNTYSGASGVLLAYDDSLAFILRTGIFFNPYLRFARLQNQLYLNGQRQVHGENYLSNSKNDLISQSGLFEENLFQIYNGESGYLE